MSRKDSQTKLLARDGPGIQTACIPSISLSRSSRVTHPIDAELVIEAGAANLEKLGGLYTIASCLLKRLKNPHTFRLAGDLTRNRTETMSHRLRSHRHEVSATEFGTGGGDDQPLNIMLQLPNIARP